MKKHEKIFVAAWLDAEGSLQLSPRPRLRICNDNSAVIFKLYKMLPGSRINRRGRKHLVLCLNRQTLIYTTLKALLPYLIVGDSKARRIIKWYEKLKDIA